MSTTKPIAWIEGMLVTPQHFEQQEQVWQHALATDIQQFKPYAWGINECEIDTSALAYGKVRFTKCSGRLQDGTLFDLDSLALSELTLDIKETIAGETLYLGLPLNNYIGEARVANRRYYLTESQLNDAFDPAANSMAVRVKQLNFSVVRETDLRDNFIYLPIARVKTADADKGIDLDNNFIYPSLNVKTNPQLDNLLTETMVLLQRKQTQLSESLRSPLQSRSIALMTDVSVLQIINRYVNVLAQYQALKYLHPLDFYLIVAQLLAELGTFYREDRLAIVAPIYQHQTPALCFSVVKQHVIDLLQTKFQHQATSIEVSKQEDGVYRSVVIDKQLLSTAKIVVCVRCENKDLQQTIEKQLKIASSDDLLTITQLQLAGIKVERLPLVPPQLPFYSDAVYLRIIKQGERWDKVVAQQTIALFSKQLSAQDTITLWAIPELDSGGSA